MKQLQLAVGLALTISFNAHSLPPVEPHHRLAPAGELHPKRIALTLNACSGTTTPS